jgi:glycosyltransferase involved in cell wall biosynthesis
LRQAKEQNLSLGFIVAGDGPRKQGFLDMVAPYASHLIFVGALPATDMTTLYANSDVGLMTYVTDSTVAMPIKFFDYLAGDLAILNSLDRDVRDIIGEHEVGLNYRPMDVNDLLEKLQSLALNQNQLKKYKGNSKNLAENYDTNTQYLVFSQFVEKIAVNQKRLEVLK